MAMVLILVFVVVPLVELAVFVQVAQWIGFLDATLLLVIVSVIGIVIVRHQGIGVYRRVREQLRAGVVPAADLVNGLLVLIAGLLMIVPGFVTAVLGLLLLLPPVRAGVRSILRRRYYVRAANRVVKVVNTRSSVTRDRPDGVVEVLPPSPRQLPPQPPDAPPRAGGAGSGQ
jgi:UPF0716 family protein affecting phage T7 exclusion